jgi:tetratricopeptide (TPR) repeat protein
VDVNFSLRSSVAILLGIILTGVSANGLSGHATSVPRNIPITPAAMAWGLLGGLRTLGANIAWLRMHTAWTERDLQATQAWLKMAVSMNPQSLYFLVNGARILAYDTPAWRLSGQPEPEGVAAQVHHEQSVLALQLLEEGAAWHADNPHWWIERGNVALNSAHDLSAAATYFRSAAELPEAPFYAARIHADLLLRLGRPAEAYAWLCQVHRSLPANNPSAQSGRILLKIRDLEAQLQLPAAQLYEPKDGAVDPTTDGIKGMPDGL